MDAESKVSNLERLNKDLNRQLTEMQDSLDTESRDKHTLMAKLRLLLLLLLRLGSSEGAGRGAYPTRPSN